MKEETSELSKLLAGMVAGVFCWELFYLPFASWARSFDPEAEPSVCARVEVAYDDITSFSEEYSEGFYSDDRLVEILYQIEELHSNCQPARETEYDF